MPFNPGTGIFTRIWKFVDQYLPGDDALRAGFDTAFDDVANGLNDAVDYFDTELAEIAGSRGLYLGEKASLPTVNNEGGALVDGNSVIVDGLHYFWKTDEWLAVGIAGADALGLILLAQPNTAPGRAAARTALGLGSTALLDWNPANITGSMRMPDNVVMGFGTGTGPAPGQSPIPSDFTIRHDGANTYMQVLGDGNVFLDSDTFTLRSKDGTKTGLTVLPAGAVTVRHNGSQRLLTNADGIEISGDVSGSAIASQAEAIAGTLLTKMMPPLRVKEAMDARRVMSPAVPTTSGTDIDFTGIPSWANWLNVHLIGVLAGASDLLLRIGTSGGIEATGYVARSSTGSGTTAVVNGFNVRQGAAGGSYDGVIRLKRLPGNQWEADHIVSKSNDPASVGGGTKTLAGVLDRIRLTNITFTGGAMFVEYGA